MTEQDFKQQLAETAREQSIAEFFNALAQLVKSCQPLVDQAIKEPVDNARNNRTQRQ